MPDVEQKMVKGKTEQLEVTTDQTKEVKRSVSKEKEFEVESILKKRIKKDKLEYFVKWKNYDETTWEPLSNLHAVREMINEFEKKQVGENAMYYFRNIIILINLLLL